MKRQDAFILLELVVVLSVIVLLLLLSSPYIRQVLIRNRIERSVFQLIQAINLGRSMAIDSNAVVVLCHSQDGNTCSGNWSDGQILFFKAIEQESRIIRHWGALQPEIEIVWNGFASKDALQFGPLGMGQAMNGSFFICWQGQDQSFNRAIIINRSGRARVSQYDSKGKAVRC